MKPVLRLLAIFAIIFIVVNYVFKIFGWFSNISNKPNKTVDHNREILNVDKQPKVGSSKGEYIDYEDVTDKG